jgi:hypothetical protein
MPRKVNIPALWVRQFRAYSYPVHSYPGLSVGLHFNDGVRLNIWVWRWCFGVEYRRG